MYAQPRFVKLIGLLMGIAVFVGFVAFHVAVLLPRPGVPQSPDPEQVAYTLTIRFLRAVFLGAVDAALGASVAFSWAWGLGKPELTEAARRGIFLFSGLFLSFWLLFTLFSTSFFQFFP